MSSVQSSPAEAFWSARLRRRLTLLEHRPDLLGEPHGFGCLLYDAKGMLQQVAGQSWLYSTFQEADGRWTSWVRSFDLARLTAGAARRILLPQLGEERAVIHNVIAIGPRCFLAFLSTGKGVRAALAETPDGTFRFIADLHLRPELSWELAGQPQESCALEANGGHVLVSEDAEELLFWQNYDSYHPALLQGDIGWFLCRFDKRAQRLEIQDRANAAPLPFRPASWGCARCGSRP